eukprot:COSAG02_NODE_59942_length_272_cov_1.763006_1_plen_41_part_10
MPSVTRGIRPYARCQRTLVYKNAFYPFCLIWGLDSGVPVRG